LTHADIEQLRGKHFIIRVPHRWRGKEGPHRETLLSPIISGPLYKPRITVAFYPDMVIAADPESKAALDNLHRAVRAVSLGIDVRPGRLVYINNKFALHSRDKFTATFDENGRAYRWIQRLSVADSLWNFRSFRQLNERVFDPSGEASTASIPWKSYRSSTKDCAVSDEAELVEMS
jgi:L-asparagine oxygenase